MRISRLASVSIGRVRSTRSPFTLATMAASARRGLMERAISMGRRTRLTGLSAAVGQGNLDVTHREISA